MGLKGGNVTMDVTRGEMETASDARFALQTAPAVVSTTEIQQASASAPAPAPGELDNNISQRENARPAEHEKHRKSGTVAAHCSSSSQPYP